MAVGVACFLSIIMIAAAVPGSRHPGQAVWNTDGSWTVDWPAIKELAAKPAYVTTGGSHASFPRLEVFIARSLLIERDAGKLLEGRPSLCPDGRHAGQ